MKPLFTLCKTEFYSLLYAMNFFNSKKKKKAFAAPLALLVGVGLMVYLGTVYSLPMATVMIPLLLQDLYWAQICFLAFIASISFTFFAGNTMLFGGKDLDFLFSLPISHRTVLFCKLIALYAENLVFTAGLILPSGVVYAVYSSSNSVGFWFSLAAVCLTVPIVSTVLSALLGFLFTFVSGRMRHKNLFGSLFSILGFFALFGVVFSMQTAISSETALYSLRETLWKFLPPLHWIAAGLAGQNTFGVALFSLISVGCLVVFLLVFSNFYRNIVLRLSTQTAQVKFKMQKQTSRSAFAALLGKESRRFFGTPTYLLNCGISALMSILAGGYLLISPQNLQSLVAVVPITQADIALFAILACSFFLLIAPPSAVSISLENKSLWVLQSAPVSASAVIFAKALFSFLLYLPGTLIFWIGIQVAFSLNPVLSLVSFVSSLSVSAFGALLGVVVNLHLPRLDAVNDTVVVKQSGSVIVCMVIGMAFVGLLALLYFGLHLSANLLLALLFVLCAVVSFGLYLYIKKQGNRLFTNLSAE